MLLVITAHDSSVSRDIIFYVRTLVYDRLVTFRDSFVNRVVWENHCTTSC